MSKAADQLIARRRSALGPSYTHFYDKPLYLVKGEGVWLFDDEGNKYLDCYNNVPSVGHCNPRVVAALTEQASTLNTHTRYLHHSIVEYAETLVATLPGELSVCAFVCTGSEANDLAYRIARSVTGNDGIAMTADAYHGNTTLVSEISSGYERKRPKPSFVEEILPPYTYRGPWGVDDPDVWGKYAGTADAAHKKLEASGHGLAAQIIDHSFDNRGVLTPDPAYFKSVYAKARAAGGLVIADEVQAGLCRLGDNMWGFMDAGVVPDIVTMGKPMGAGHPLAIVVTTPDIAEKFAEETNYFNTFGGNPVSCSVGKAVLDEVERMDLMKNAHETGLKLRAGFDELAEKYSIIGEVRGKGLFYGIELVRDRESKEPASEETINIVESLRLDGVLISVVGEFKNILKIRPALIFASEHADILLNKLEKQLSKHC